MILEVVRELAAEYETDVPVTDESWPADVLAAADVLRHLAGVSGRVEDSGYARTGVMRSDHDGWAAFAAFAPWAYDATVWDRASRVVVELSDEGGSVVVNAEAELYDSLVRALGDARVLANLRRWRDGGLVRGG
ncbi:hypothetical protein [Kribbella hippodromi]|uniref:hypothetical protein n=1 Tax=Kribbella hippodromi TaxID=434347 RepID=UPI0031D5C7D5